MFAEDPPKPPPNPIVIAVVTAALTTVATKLAEWAVHELKKKYGTKEKYEEHHDR
jgi:cytochrome oxidase assembly protein ShyY1